MGRARQLLKEEHRDKALPLLRKVVELCPENVPAHVRYQDQALLARGQGEQSMRDYYRRLPDDRSSPLVPFLLARLAPHEVECKKLLEESIDRDGYFGYAWLEMAYMRRGVSQPDQALKAVQRCLEVRGDLMPAQKLAAELYLELGFPERAASHYDAYLRRRPNDERARRAYAWLLVNQLNKPEDAEPIVRELLQRHTDDVDLQLELAAIQWRTGRRDDAIATYQHVLRLEPRNALAALNLGDLYYDSFESEEVSTDDKRKAWHKARQAYRYYLSIEDDSRALLVLNRISGVPYRLKQIEKLLGPANGEVRVEDLAPSKSAIQASEDGATPPRR